MKTLICAALFFFSTLTFASCPFCDPSVIEKACIFENQLLMVLQDRAPIAKGHLLIIPKRHVARAHELFQDEWKELTDTLPRVVTIFQKAFNTDQYLILEKNGPYAGQTVFHVHFHVIPIPSYKDEDVIKFTLFSKIFDIKPYRLDDEELKEEVTSLRHYFQEPIEVVQ